jgi:hypothetical protein
MRLCTKNIAGTDRPLVRSRLELLAKFLGKEQRSISKAWIICQERGHRRELILLFMFIGALGCIIKIVLAAHREHFVDQEKEICIVVSNAWKNVYMERTFFHVEDVVDWSGWCR